MMLKNIILIYGMVNLFFLINIKFSLQCIPDHYQQAHVDKFLYMNQSLMHLIDNGNLIQIQHTYMYILAY